GIIEILPSLMDNSDERICRREDFNNAYTNMSEKQGLVFIALYRQLNEHMDELKKLFEKMGYMVPEPHCNMTYEETEKAIADFIETPGLEHANACIVIIMSDSGHKEYFETSDKIKMDTDGIVNKFNNRRCHKLVGTPKIFIFDCYRNVSVLPECLSTVQSGHKSGRKTKKE
ncbi:unnamed protein product, partial [Meganyctiphanes norvegica]